MQLIIKCVVSALQHESIKTHIKSIRSIKHRAAHKNCINTWNKNPKKTEKYCKMLQETRETYWENLQELGEQQKQVTDDLFHGGNV